VTRKLFVVVAALAFGGLSLVAQSKPSIQGVWRVVEVTITSPTPTPGGLPKGTHSNVQPSLLIFAGKHYSTLSDTAAKPRPASGFKVTDKPTAEEMATQWGPFTANAGTYELSGNTLTRRIIVAKNPALQGGKSMTRSTVRLEGNNLWLTTTENSAGKIANPTTIKYVRAE
jgi:hypothetical protein